jgi:SAM-dependent methyltransferase
MQLPFPDASFDVVVCQFGAMFFPDKAKAFAEARRVINPGGCFLFNVWDGARDNDFAEVIGQSLNSAFPDDPPTFLYRVPHGYYDHATIANHLAQAGFEKAPQFFTISERSRIESARAAAIAYCQGTPVRNEIEKRDSTRLAEITDIATTALEKKFGSGAIEGKIQAQVVVVER